MSITLDKLKKLADLAYLSTDDATQLLHETNVILSEIDILRNINTDNIEPLLHPVSTHQTLRMQDYASSYNWVNELASIAPLFVDDHYLVPTVIEGE